VIKPDPDGFRFETLQRHHNRSAFSCGVEALDRYLQTQARQEAQRNVASVYVLIDTEADRIVGYYTLSAAAIDTSHLSNDVARRFPRYEHLPATLLGRLAVDSEYRSMQFGRFLLFNALRRAYEHREHIASMAVIVDAIDEAAATFYERFGFQRPKSNDLALFLTMASIADVVP
jgi:GNAT superfamily N-acetyltransferase